MSDLRVQGDPWAELCAVSEGFCPDCLIHFDPAWKTICPRCLKRWSVFWTADGWPGYEYSHGDTAEWYYAPAGGPSA